MHGETEHNDEDQPTSGGGRQPEPSEILWLYIYFDFLLYYSEWDYVST